MKKIRLSLAFFVLFGLAAAQASEKTGWVDLGGKWGMKDYTRGMGIKREVFLPGHAPADALPCTVPGTVRAALLEAREIPDPYYGYDNEKSLWIEEKEWWFFRTFPADTAWRNRRVEIVFDGVSFQGEVWLNGRPLGELKGMMNPRAFDVTSALVPGENALAVRLEAPEDARRNERARGLTWDTARDHLYSIAQCMFGWDWGPHGVPVGLWQPVRLRVTGSLRADRPQVRARVHSPSSASLQVAVDVENLSDQAREGQVQGLILEKDTQRKAGEFRQAVRLGPGERRTLAFTVTVRKPRLWWPNGMGDQPLYLLRATVYEGAAVSDNVKVQFGIRELKLVENENVDEFLKSMKEHTGSVYRLGRAVGSYPWTFQVNGRKMFAKGGNWIPVDQMLRIGPERYERLLTLARDAHFNLLRVWGGGLYETEDFYERCDAYGILAWQEFLSNRSFSKIDRENFLEGAESAVFRLRNHPSLTFWCGGNEFDPDDLGSKSVIDALDSLLRARDPEREFHRASPYMGDDHYWGVWHENEPYTAYRVVRPFRSEAGVNAFPVAESYRRFTPESLLWPPDTTWIDYHGEYNTRFAHLRKLRRYADEFGAAGNIDELIRNSQLYQALADGFDMEFCRSNQFRNSGFLVWQFNDIWPCLSWSLVDWYGTPKPAYFFMKRASRPVHLFPDFEKYLWKAGETFAADILLVNDSETAVSGCTFRARLMAPDGRLLAEKTGRAETGALKTARLDRIEWPVPAAMAGHAFFVTSELFGPDGAKLSDAAYPIAVGRTPAPEDFANAFAELNRMPRADVKALLTEAGPSSVSVRLSNASAAPAFFVRLRLDGEGETADADYSDNYLFLMPGETKTVTVASRPKAPGTAGTPPGIEVSGWNVPAFLTGTGAGR